MPAEGDPEEQLVTITAAPPPQLDPVDRPWIGPLVIIGMPIAAAVAVFLLLLYG